MLSKNQLAHSEIQAIGERLRAAESEREQLDARLDVLGAHLDHSKAELAEAVKQVLLVPTKCFSLPLAFIQCRRTLPILPPRMPWACIAPRLVLVPFLYQAAL